MKKTSRKIKVKAFLFWLSIVNLFKIFISKRRYEAFVLKKTLNKILFSVTDEFDLVRIIDGIKSMGFVPDNDTYHNKISFDQLVHAKTVSSRLRKIGTTVVELSIYLDVGEQGEDILSIIRGIKTNLETVNNQGYVPITFQWFVKKSANKQEEKDFVFTFAKQLLRATTSM